MNGKRKKVTRMAITALLGTVALGAASAMPAQAETEIQALKRQLAEQRALIDKLLATQNSQKAAIEKIETRTAQAPEQLSAPASAPAPAPATGSILPNGLSWYATLDVNIANTDSGFGRKFTVGSGGMTQSSLGLKADKELTNGLHAIGEIEMGLDLSTGVASNGPITNGANTDYPSSGSLLGTGNQLFSRQAYAGLGSDMFGKLTLGRQYTGSYIGAAIEGNAFGAGFYGASGLLLPVIGGMPTRVNNSIVYRTPDFEGFLKGFSVWGTYTAGSENNVDSNIVSGNGVTDSSGEGYDLAMFYRLKGLTAAVTAWTITNVSFISPYGQGQHEGWQAVASYDFDVVKLYGTYVSGWYNGSGAQDGNIALSDADGWSVSAKVPFLTDHAVLASYAAVNDKSNLSDADAQLVGIGYTYKLFKATTLYVNWGKQFNGKNTAVGLRGLKNGGDLAGTVNPETGYNPDGVMIGLNTKF